MGNQTNDEGLTPVNLFCKRHHISRNAFYDEVKDKHLRIVKVRSRTYVTPQDEGEWIELLRQASPSLGAKRPKATPSMTVDPSLQPKL